MADYVSATCWCESVCVMIPVQWVSEGLTGSCGQGGCGPGCPSRNTIDSFDDSETVAATGRKTTKMHRFDAKAYNPKTDSSLGYTQSDTRRFNPEHLILQVYRDDETEQALCPCGCAEPPRGKKAVFGMGHDARLRGKLSRACAAGVSAVLTDESQRTREIVDPVEYASRFSTEKLDWGAAVRESAGRAKNGASAEQEILKRALGPQVGETKLIKVGRWEKTGRILAVYEDGSGILYEYVDARGNARRARQDAEGKVRDVPTEEAVPA